MMNPLLMQIVTESFPISSSAHMQLVQLITGYWYIPTAVVYAAHLPTVMVLLFFFIPDWLPTLCGLHRTWPYVVRIIGYGIVADSITVAWYLLFAFCHIQIPLWLGCAATAALLLSVRWCKDNNYVSMNIQTAALLGCIQGIALMPGISRFASTYVIGRWCRLRPMRAFTWSMMIQWPLIVAASGYGWYQLYHNPLVQLLHMSDCLSMLGATGIAYVGLYCVRGMIVHEYMWLWGIYMIIPTVVAWYYKL